MKMLFLLPSVRRARHQGATQRQRFSASLQLEPLEGRSLPSCNVISGHVYSDANNNGLFDRGESPIAGSTLELRNSANVVVSTAVTDANGYYEFSTDSTISTASTTLTQTASYSAQPTDWSRTQSVPQFDPAQGTLTAVKITNAGSITSQIKVESLDGAPSTITATVSGTLTLAVASLPSIVTNNSSNKTFNASSYDGTTDFGGSSGTDFGAQAATGANTLTLTAAAESALFRGTGRVNFTETAHATSAARGAGNLLTLINTMATAQVSVLYAYIPSNCLRAGAYTIRQTTQPAGYLDGREARNGTVLPGSAGTDVITVTLATSDLVNNDFGEVVPASVAGYVYVDLNDNGIKELGESGLAAVTVTLAGTDDVGAPVRLAQTTAADGSYRFTNLRPGSYGLTETQPADYRDGKDTLGSVGGTVTNDQFAAIALASGVNGINYNFGELTPPVPTTLILADSFAVSHNMVRPQDLVLLSKLQFLATPGQASLDANTLTQVIFVDGLYRNLLNRPADLTGFSTWVPRLLNGTSRAQIVHSIWISAEHRGVQVDRLYQTFLHRNPDPGGRTFWVNALLNGTTETEVARRLITSGEYQASHPDNASFLAALYADILGRPIDAAGLAAWTQQLQNGVSRDTVAQAILTSDEAFLKVLECAYMHFLHRSLDAGGRQFWLTQYRTGQVTPAAVCEAILASDEYFAQAQNASRG